MMRKVCPWQTLCFSIPILVGWLEFSGFTAIREIRKCICICGILLHSEGDLREECNKKKVALLHSEGDLQFGHSGGLSCGFSFLCFPAFTASLVLHFR